MPNIILLNQLVSLAYSNVVFYLSSFTTFLLTYYKYCLFIFIHFLKQVFFEEAHIFLMSLPNIFEFLCCCATAEVKKIQPSTNKSALIFLIVWSYISSMLYIFIYFFSRSWTREWSDKWWQLQRGCFWLASWHLDRPRVLRPAYCHFVAAAVRRWNPKGQRKGKKNHRNNLEKVHIMG